MESIDTVNAKIYKNEPVGDVTSDKRGSGARFNAGKVPYELLPLGVLIEDWRATPAHRILRHLAEWQRGSSSSLVDALNATVSPTSELTLERYADAARVFDYGRKKYAEWNWAMGMNWSVPLGCAVRHCLSILNDEWTDPESGLPHMAHVQCNLIMLLTFARTYPEGDDRPVKWLKVSD